jgi:hypothetical protein
LPDPTRQFAVEVSPVNDGSPVSGPCDAVHRSILKALTRQALFTRARRGHAY